MRFLLATICLLILCTTSRADEQAAAEALKQAKAQVVQDRKTKTVTEVRFTSKAHGDPLLDHVAECQDLEKIFIAGPGDFSDEGVAKLSGLKKLTNANLLSKNFTDKSVAAIAQAPRVKWLSLSGTKITDAAGDDLKKMQNLEMLSVAMIPVSNDLVAKLTELPQLKDLHLTGTKVDDQVFPHLAKLKALRLVALHGTKVTPAAVEAFKKAHPEVIVGSDPPRP